VYEVVVPLGEVSQHGGVVGVLFPQQEDFGDFIEVGVGVLGPGGGLDYVQELRTEFQSRFDNGTFSVVVPRADLYDVSVSQSQIEGGLEGVGSEFDGESRTGPTSLFVERVETGISHAYFDGYLLEIVPKTIDHQEHYKNSPLPVVQSVQVVGIDPGVLSFHETPTLLVLVPQGQKRRFGVEGTEDLVPVVVVERLGPKIEQERSPVELNVIPFAEVVALDVLHVGGALRDLVADPRKVQIVVFVDDGELETGSDGTVDDGLGVFLVLGIVESFGGAGPVNERPLDSGSLHRSQLPVDDVGVAGSVRTDLGVVERGDVLLTVDDVVGVAVRHGPVDAPLAAVALFRLEPGHHVDVDVGAVGRKGPGE
jgi:hypothetical protein